MAPGVYKSFKKNLKANLRKAKGYIDDGTEYTRKIINRLIEEESRILNVDNDHLAELDKYIIDIDKDYEISNDYKINMYFSKIMRDTYEDTKAQCYQAMEGIVHNLNTLHSRAGAQVRKLPIISEMV